MDDVYCLSWSSAGSLVILTGWPGRWWVCLMTRPRGWWGPRMLPTTEVTNANSTSLQSICPGQQTYQQQRNIINKIFAKEADGTTPLRKKILPNPIPGVTNRLELVKKFKIFLTSNRNSRELEKCHLSIKTIKNNFLIIKEKSKIVD